MPKSNQMRWLVLPPSADRSIWLTAISEQAKTLGLTLAFDDASQDDTDMVITSDADTALTANADANHIAVLLSQAGPLPPELAGLEANPGRHSTVTSASALRLRAYKIPTHRHFTAEKIASGPVPLFDDFSLHIPAALPTNVERRNRGLVEAMTVYCHDQAIWSPDILDIYATVTNRSARSVTLDATGKPRFVIHGPYMNMPKGTWQVIVHLEFDQSLCGKAFSLHWGGLSEYSNLKIWPERPGLYKIQLDWTWDAPAPCEFRFIAEEGIFDGSITFHNLEVNRLG